MSIRTRRSIPASARAFAAMAIVAALVATGLTPATAQTPGPSGTAEPAPSPGPDADLALTMRGPGTVPLVGDTFDYVITVTNSGPSDASDVLVSDYLPEGVSFESASSSDPTDTCALESEPPPPSEPQPAPEPADGGGSGAASPSFPPAISCRLGTTPSGSTTTIRLTVTRTNAREIWNGASVSSSNNDPTYENNFDEVVIEADQSRPADVAITKTAPGEIAVGDSFDYLLTVRNLGPSRASNVVVRDFLPDGVDFNSATSSDTTDTCTLFGPSTASQGQAPELYQPRELVCELGSLADGDRVVISLNVTRTSGHEVWNSAWVSISNYDPNFENDYGEAVLAADPSVTSDLTMTLTGPATTPLVGERFDLVARVSNAGPAAAPDVSLSNYMPDGLRFESASSSDASDSCTENSVEDQPRPLADEAAASSAPFGGGVTCSLGTLASGETATITFTMTRTNARETWASASAWSSNHDPNFENNYDDVMIEPDRSNPADVAVSMSAPDNPEVGSRFEYVITVTNTGPSPAQDAMVTDFLPEGVDFNSVSSSDPSDACALVEQPPSDRQPQEAPYHLPPSEVRCDLGTLAVDEIATIRIQVTRTSEYEIWNSAWTSITNYDPNFENDFAESYVVGKRPPGYCPAGQVEPARDAPTADQSRPVEGCDSSTTVCGTEGSDEIVIDDCAVMSGGGGDQIEVSPTRDSARAIKVSSGVGGDNILVDVASDSPRTRRIVINAGRGRDQITLRLAPGVGNVSVLIRGGSGNDRIDVDISAPAGGIEVLARGGDDDDRIRSFASLDPGAGERPPGVALAGGAGRDAILAGMGDDAIGGGRGRDSLGGGPGDDTIRGGSGRDRCFGGPGRDSLHSC